jgi:hypothetical protein
LLREAWTRPLPGADARSLRQWDPRGVAAALSDHTVEEARARGWDTSKNGELLDAAEAAGFEVFVTADRNIRYRQNLTDRKIAVVLGKARWKRSQKGSTTLSRQWPLPNPAACPRETSD